MTHLGSARDEGEIKARQKVLQGLIKALTNYNGRTSFLIENSAGSGHIIGSNLDEIKWLIKKIEAKTNGVNVGLCYDTCHGFSSGYDMRDSKSINKTISTIDGIIGLKKLGVIHINDSKTELGSRIDRHEHVGEGKIGEKGFGLLLNHPRLKSKDAILETPITPRKDRKKDLNVLFKLRNKG